MPTDNVVDGQLIDKEALKLAQDILLDPVVVTKRQYRDAGTELGGRIVHASILQNIKLLTSGDVELVAGGKEQLTEDELQYIHQESDELYERNEAVLDSDELIGLDRYDLKGRVHDTG